jgi:hypothetical protein
VAVAVEHVAQRPRHDERDRAAKTPSGCAHGTCLPR